jgi:uncharacterized membrane protein YcaP (DUF421 family)
MMPSRARRAYAISLPREIVPATRTSSEDLKMSDPKRNGPKYSLVGDDTSLIGGLISATTLVVFAYGISFLTSHSKLAERILEGTPKILVRHGRRRPAEMAKQRISTSELTEALRHQGCASISRVRAAILENDGRITVLKA